MKFDVVVIGGGESGFAEAMKSVYEGKSCAMLSEGLSLDKPDYDSFKKAGGVLLMGDSAVAAEFDGNRVTSIRTQKLGNTKIEAELFILATGRFFSKGLIADMKTVRETVMGLNLDFDADRSKWFDDDFFAQQQFMSRGVVTDSEGHPYKGETKIVNVKVVGSILSQKKK